MLGDGITMNFGSLAGGLLLFLLAASALASKGPSTLLSSKAVASFPVEFKYKTYQAANGIASIYDTYLILVSIVSVPRFISNSYRSMMRRFIGMMGLSCHLKAFIQKKKKIRVLQALNFD